MNLLNLPDTDYFVILWMVRCYLSIHNFLFVLRTIKYFIFVLFLRITKCIACVGDLKWQDMEVPIAACLGFRIVPNRSDNEPLQQTRLKRSPFLDEDKVCPWEGLEFFSLPDFSDSSNVKLGAHLEDDLPQDKKSTGNI